jgi:hypothetical protein
LNNALYGKVHGVLCLALGWDFCIYSHSFHKYIHWKQLYSNFFIIKQSEIVKIFHKNKEENWSEQEDLDKFYKIVQNYFAI